jgi:predicted secreted protein
MARKPPKGKSLTEVNPELAKQWHPTKNIDLTPNDVTMASDLSVWWKCDKADDHEWETKIYSRKDRGCPMCSNRKVVLSNCLQTTHPEIAKQWHPTKNGDLTALNVVAGATKKIWWKCDKGHDHEWITGVNARTQGTNCPICSNKKVVLSNCLQTTHPEIAKQWHPTKNGHLTPFDVMIGTSKQIWWKCDKADDHEWATKQRMRRNGKVSICPFCSGHKTTFSNSLEKLRPEIAKEWHPKKNKKKASEVAEFSHYYAWWKCDKGNDHEWQSYVLNRSRGTGCPFCKNKKISSDNSVVNTHPQFIKDFHPTKNGNVSLSEYVSGSTKQIWWKCDKADDHEWRTSIRKRAGGDNCPMCSGHKTVY